MFFINIVIRNGFQDTIIQKNVLFLSASVLEVYQNCIGLVYLQKKRHFRVVDFFLMSRNTTFDTTSYPSLFFCIPIKQMKSHPHLFNSSIFNTPSFFYCYTKYNGQVFFF